MVVTVMLDLLAVRLLKPKIPAKRQSKITTDYCEMAAVTVISSRCKISIPNLYCKLDKRTGKIYFGNINILFPGRFHSGRFHSR